MGPINNGMPSRTPGGSGCEHDDDDDDDLEPPAPCPDLRPKKARPPSCNMLDLLLQALDLQIEASLLFVAQLQIQQLRFFLLDQDWQNIALSWNPAVRQLLAYALQRRGGKCCSVQLCSTGCCC
ncbi:unnamed protein product [Polarella glacialis]|uniref:Uncharacterized protein n=1 Tax=Polarella glacialis TaxID=89957 RepID=A0A813INM8_POLGL|nr:unnamed protein product [Polarella glacialis]